MDPCDFAYYVVIVAWVVCCSLLYLGVFFFKQKTAYEMRISDWSSDVCSSDLHRQAGQVGDHGLEVEQGLEAPLGDLRLVGRVGGVPARVLEHVAPDHRRGHRAVVAETDHGLGRAVASRELTQLAGPRDKIGSASGREKVCTDV